MSCFTTQASLGGFLKKCAYWYSDLVNHVTDKHVGLIFFNYGANSPHEKLLVSLHASVCILLMWSIVLEKDWHCLVFSRNLNIFHLEKTKTKLNCRIYWSIFIQLIPDHLTVTHCFRLAGKSSPWKTANSKRPKHDQFRSSHPARLALMSPLDHFIFIVLMRK